ncbi:uncharacterized protein LOC117106090 [Anneissia japonica]|uniref:uncharacterized protein LOC117106090 n=1 Tax=Anneissia japonica TaxID=1529436 RepID=UPI0014258E75|nr:uncharacterized protein LOC117106090 [Anneissia japonica]
MVKFNSIRMTSNRRNIQTQSKRRYRSNLGEHNLNILKSFWKRGMTSFRDEKKKELVRQAAFETGMTENQVKDWIGNYKRQQTGKAYPKYCRLRRKPPNGYNLFVSEYVKQEIANGTPRHVALHSASKVWQIKKSSGESLAYFKRAQEMRLPTVEEMTKTQKKVAITRLVTEVNEKIEALEKLGVEGMAMFVVPSTGKVYQLSNNSGIQSVQINNTEASSSRDGETNVNDMSRVMLRAGVQKLFNDSFCKYF